ncbi:MAG: hypothetical protein ACR2NP_19785 [Pirellulaceae bacterium]
MGFHEKSAWVCLLCILVVYVPYFWLVFSVPHVAVSIVAFVGATIVLALLMSLFQVMVALSTRRVWTTGDVPPPDERELIIELKASKIAGIVMGCAVIIWCMLAMVGIAGVSDDGEVSHRIAVLGCQSMFAAFVFANVVYYASLILGYRRSA